MSSELLDTSEQPEVELIGITKTFGDVVANRDINLSIKKNEFFSLLGPSGCGKTTSLRIICGLEKPDEGIVKLRGEVVNDIPPHKRNVGLLFQRLALFPHLNVFKNIAFGLQMQKIPKEEHRERVIEMLEITRLEGYENRKITELSGGEQQRVALGRSLVTRPTVLLLDEPLASLDRKIRTHMMLELKRIQKEVGTTFIYVTHDQEVAITMSDRIAIMNDGEIDQIDTPLNIYFRPKNQFVASFLGETNIITGQYDGSEFFKPDDIDKKILVEANPELEGERVVLCVRPHFITFGRHLDTENVVEGSVKEIIFKGESCLVHFEVGKDLELICRENTISGVQRLYKIGDKLEIGWNKMDGIIVPT